MAEKVIGCTMWVWCLVILGVIFASTSPANGISCRQAVLEIWACEPYLLGYGIVTLPCCFGAAALNQQIAAANQQERQGVCECLKQAGKSMEFQLDRAKLLPQLCLINATIPVDENLDCSRV